MNNNIKHLFFCIYNLQPKNQGKVRQGALLKVEFQNGTTGHADLHPYPEKGEHTLDFCLHQLKQKKTDLPLCQRALAIAHLEALNPSRNLLSHLNVPQSHYLITHLKNFKAFDKALAQGFRTFKVKLTPPLKEQTHTLLKLIKAGGLSVKWRIDFYQNLNQKAWQEWQNIFLPFSKKCIDFIEAPFVYKEKNSWALPSPYSLAYDVWSGENTLPVQALVFKSSRKTIKDLLKKTHLFKRVIFTHTLAHPLDQITSATFASHFYKIAPHLKEVCGLVQTDIYEESDWTLPHQGPLFPQLSGPGWGLSHLLNKQAWKKLF